VLLYLTNLKYIIKRTNKMKSYWLTNGRIIDGTGTAAREGNILIEDERIIRIQKETPDDSLPQIDCEDHIVAPGFIDIHSHLDWFAGNEESRELIMPFLQQGITTAVGGNCGFSTFGFPVSHPYRELLSDNIFRAGRAKLSWQNAEGFEKHIDDNGSPLNILSYVGHGTTRTSIRGYDATPLTDKELKQLINLLDESLKQGACGISLGLQYEPGIFADKKELKAVAELAKSHNKVLAVHAKASSAVSGTYPMKLFGTPHHILAIQDMIELAEETGVRLQFSHLIFVGSQSWKSADKVFKLFEDAKARGVDICFDTYGYSLGASRINVILPEWFLAELKKNLESKSALRRLWIEIKAMELVLGFGYEQIRVTNTVYPAWEKYNGLYLSEIARQLGQSSFKTLCDLVRLSNGAASVLMERYSNPEILKRMIAHPQAHYQTDAWMEREGINNPAIYGSIPRILRLSRENNLLSIEESIRKMTGSAAERLGIPERGMIKEGYFADLVVFDEKTISDRVGEKGIPLPPEGIKRVIVNGQILLSPETAQDVNPEGKEMPGKFISL
jgi:N-acyl-D-aspartate/D-glutamate deacylase